MEELYTCRCGRQWDGYAQCFPCPAEDSDWSDNDDYINDYNEDYNDELPGNPWIYPGHEDDELDIEYRRLEYFLDMEEKKINISLTNKKETCFDIINLIDEHKEELGDGKYKAMLDLLKHDLFDKLNNESSIIIRTNSRVFILNDNLDVIN